MRLNEKLEGPQELIGWTDIVLLALKGIVLNILLAR